MFVLRYEGAMFIKETEFENDFPALHLIYDKIREIDDYYSWELFFEKNGTRMLLMKSE